MIMMSNLYIKNKIVASRFIYILSKLCNIFLITDIFSSDNLKIFISDVLPCLFIGTFPSSKTHLLV